MIPDTYKHVIPTIEMMKLSDAMKRIDLDSFVGEVLELILLNLRMEPSAGEKEMRYTLVLTMAIFEWYVSCSLSYLSIHILAMKSSRGRGCASQYDFHFFALWLR